jgi:dTDP-4-dehydrorhamnose reductase
MKNPSKRVLVLGASGMLGNATFRVFAQSPGFEAFGSVRTAKTLNFFPPLTHARIISGVDVENFDSLQNLFRDVQPDFVINCVGIIKQLAKSNDVLSIVPINSLLPHRLAQLCAIHNARLVHISTDCVFSGSKGMYVESDNAVNIWGK